jgi:hypothetical protein
MKLLFALIPFAVCAATAQGLPPPSRTVYKCEEAGKVYYSDSPCLGAKKIEVQPTRGLNKSTGKELIGQDVRRERHQDSVAQGLRPLTGKGTEALYRAGRRSQLSPESQRTCSQLDLELPKAEAAERAAEDGESLRAAQVHLLRLRTLYRENRCE